MSTTVPSNQKNHSDNYFNVTRHEMLSFVPEGIKNSLEVGCGSGIFSGALMQSGKIENAWGLELDKSAATKATEILSEVRVGDAEKTIHELPDNFFDAIIFNDSLEHLVDPFKFLEKARNKLAPDGLIIASIPNVRHYKNLYNLIFKKQWRYEDAGILDRTHLRFFTEQSIVDTFSIAGYNIKKIEGINGTRKGKIRILGPLTLGLLSDIRFLQFAVVAQVRKQ